jgi:hypothetical protein
LFDPLSRSPAGIRNLYETRFTRSVNISLLFAFRDEEFKKQEQMEQQQIWKGQSSDTPQIQVFVANTRAHYLRKSSV